MASYAVVWRTSTNDDGAIPGRLEIGASSLTFHGGTRGDNQHLDIPFTDICGVSRSSIGVDHRPALRLDIHGLGALLFATVGGVGLRGEILEQLQSIINALG